ncbi:MAG: hypothetical protein ACM3X6_07200 [Patescibacteria group bacterium]
MYQRLVVRIFVLAVAAAFILTVAGCRDRAGRSPATPPVALTRRFESGGLSFAYPASWSEIEIDTLTRLRERIELRRSEELLTILVAGDDSCQMEVSQQSSRMTFADLQQRAKWLSQQIKKRPQATILAKYRVQAVELSKGPKALWSEEVRKKGDTLIRYQFVAGGFLYDVCFNYPNTKVSAQGRDLRERIMATLTVVD